MQRQLHPGRPFCETYHNLPVLRFTAMSGGSYAAIKSSNEDRKLWAVCVRPPIYFTSSKAMKVTNLCRGLAVSKKKLKQDIVHCISSFCGV